MYIDWLPSYSVGVKEIDDQHKQFVLLINDLNDTLEICCEEIELGDIIKQLLAYADYHFATEEKYFDSFSYPGTEKHKKIHQDFRNTVVDFQKKYFGQENKVAKEVMNFMKDWLADHINTVDKDYSKCFKENGL